MIRATAISILALVASCVLAAPLPKGVPGLVVKSAGELKLPNVFVQDAAFLGEEKMVAVGTVPDDETGSINDLAPSGAVLDLAKKAHSPFSNKHTARMDGVCLLGDHILTTSIHRDPYLRVWDNKAGKSLDEIGITEPGQDNATYGITRLHKTNQVAVTAKDRVLVFDPAKPKERVEYPLPESSKGWTGERVAVSPDDKWIAGTAGFANICFWNAATKKARALSIAPEKFEDEDDWSARGVCFTPKGELLAWRMNGPAEVSAGKPEASVPAERRGIVRVDLKTGKVTPLGIGHTVYTMTCAVDPTGTWLATGGRSHLDKPKGDEKVGGELRVYHLPTLALVHKEQVGGLPLTKVLFSPSGKRLAATTAGGVVRWWDVSAK